LIIYKQLTGAWQQFGIWPGYHSKMRLTDNEKVLVKIKNAKKRHRNAVTDLNSTLHVKSKYNGECVSTINMT
jgi:hypothetical protein